MSESSMEDVLRELDEVECEFLDVVSRWQTISDAVTFETALDVEARTETARRHLREIKGRVAVMEARDDA